MVSPRRKLFRRKPVVSLRRTEEKHILLRRANFVANGFRKETGHPGPTSENILIGKQFRSVCKHEASAQPAFKIIGQHATLSVFAPLRPEPFPHRLTGYSCRQKTTVWFVNAPTHSIRVDLWPPSDD